MKDQDRMNPLRRVDDATAKQISEQYPADWDMDAVFRESMRKYRQMQSGDAEPFTAKPERSIHMHINRWVTAACLLLTAGIAGAVGYMQLSAAKPDVLSPESADTAVTVVTEQTLPASEPVTTAAYTLSLSAAGTTAPASAEPSAQTVTVTAAAPSPSGTTAAGETSAKPAQTDAAQQPAADTVTVAPKQTTAQPRRQTTAAPKQTTAVRATELPATETQSIDETRPPHENAEDPAPVMPAEPTGEDSPDESERESAGTAPKGDAAADDAPESERTKGELRIIFDDSRSTTQFFTEYLFEDTTPYPMPEFSVALDGYTAVSESENGYKYMNKITAPDGSEYYPYFSSGVSTWQIHSRASFPRYEETAVSGSRAYMLYGPKATELIWFDGRYVVSMHTNSGTAEELLKIAEALITH